jgi:tripartite-type tricarboxylate transporter receptor subunit TctC
MRSKKPQLFRILGILLVLFTLLSLSTAVAMAASYPSKPVRFVIPFAPGGGADIVGRLIAAKLAERLGKQVVVDNRGGAGTILGTEIVAKADPDGYTMLLGSSAYTTNPALQKLPYDPMKSFTPIARVGSALNALIIHPSVPANSVKELIALAKQKPGQLIFLATGPGGIAHMGTELFKMMADIDFKIVQFKGGGPAMTDLLGGHSHAYFNTLIQALPYIKSGKLRVLGTSGVKRSVALPDVPAIAEALPGYESTVWWGILVPAGTPMPIVDSLNNELKAILALDEVKKWFLNQGAEADYLGPTEFGAFLEREMAKWARVIKKANIKLEE